MFVVLVGKDLVYALLQISPINFVVAAPLTSLNPLRLNEHSLSVLFVSGIVLGKYGVFMLLDHFNPRLLQTLADEHLKDGFNF